MKIINFLFWAIFSKIYSQFIKFRIFKKINTKYPYTLFSIPKNHIFVGYYDFNPIDEQDNYLLCNKVDENNKCTVGFFEINSKNIQFKSIQKTECWSWQLGARLKWSTKYQKSFYFNYFSKEKKIFQTIRYSINEKKFHYFENCFFDINYNEDKKLFLNFNRLENFRPGYGHKIKIDKQNYLNNPEDDGIFIQDINQKQNKVKLLISIYEIAELENSSKKKIQHYFNHLSFNPTGNKFLFFDCWTEDKKRRTKIFISNLNGNYYYIEDLEIASHYLWLSDTEILIYFKPVNKTVGFYIYNINLKTLALQSFMQKNDGHPHLLKKNRVLIDTYANRLSFRKLYFYNTEKKKKLLIGEFFTSKKFITGEMKCDLHPRISNTNRLISLDLGKENFRETIILINKNY